MVQKQLEEFLLREVFPFSNDIDQNPDLLLKALHRMAELDLLALNRPTEFGGPALSTKEYSACREMMAKTSGALAFLQTQHHTAGRIIADSNNQTRKKEYLPYLSDGKKLLAISFAQLRMKERCPIVATEKDDKFILNGILPWITGFHFFNEILVGVPLPNKKVVFGFIPFAACDGLKFSEPLQMMTMMSTNTVSANLENYQLLSDKVLMFDTDEWIDIIDERYIKRPPEYVFGCTASALELLEAAGKHKKEQSTIEASQRLTEELNKLREAFHHRKTEEAVALHAKARILMFNAAIASATAWSGASVFYSHSAQRVYREAMAWNVLAQTKNVRSSMLNQI